jgi:hypothetical protein
MLKVHIHNLVSEETRIAIVPTLEDAIAIESRYNLELGDNFSALIEAE